MLEEEMSKPFERAAAKLGFTNIVPEVPIMHRCADYVMISPGGEFVSVELKVCKWRHAIEQARVHALASDRAYICLPEGYHTEEFYEALSEADIGFMSLSMKDETLEIIREPQKRCVPLFRINLEKRMEYIVSEEN